MSRSENLPVLPQIVSQVLKTIDDPNSGPRSLEQILERDPGITAKLLKVANSAAYSSSEVPSISRALALLGLNTVRSLVVSVGYQQMTSARETSKLFSKVEFWSHSLAVGIATRILARIRFPAMAEELYTAGMMHDIGLMILDRFCPEELDASIVEAREGKRPLYETLRENLGYDQAQVGGIVAERWELPARVCHAIRYHLNPFEDDKHQDASSLVGAANVLAHQCGFENHVPGVPVEFDAVAEMTVDLPEEQLSVIRQVVVAEVAKSEAAFHIRRAA